MNVCERYELMISAMLDGELDEREKAELSAHIAGCERCTALAAAFAAASGALAEGLEEPPEGLQGAIMEKVEIAAKVRRSQSRFMRLRPIIAAAACVAVVAVTLLAANHGVRSAKDAAGGAAEIFAAAPEAPSYAGGEGSAAMYDADDAGWENAGAGPMEAPAPDPAPTMVSSGASMENAPSETRSINGEAMPEEALAESVADMAEPESEADVPAAGLPALEVEAVAAGQGSFTAMVLADPSGYFAPGGQITVFSDAAVTPGMRVTVRYSAAGAEPGAYYVTAEEIEIGE